MSGAGQHLHNIGNNIRSRIHYTERRVKILKSTGRCSVAFFLTKTMRYYTKT